MQKHAYLSGIVEQFVGWLAEHLDSAEFTHSYSNRRTNDQWTCNSIYHAYQQYDWQHPGIEKLGVAAGRTYVTNSRALAAMRDELNTAITSGDDLRTQVAAGCVMHWGGVSRGNVTWLIATQKGLAQLIGKTSVALDAGDIESVPRCSGVLRFNAGMTKIYSLICKDFIIYDSRVAAALGLAIVKFYRQIGHTELEERLMFPVPPHYEASTATNPKRRDPSEAELIFPALRAALPYVRWNIRANWLLNAVLDHPAAQSSRFLELASRSEQLRALEAALFMIGYDLPGEAKRKAIRQKPVVEIASDWSEAKMPKSRKGFCYRITDAAIEVLYSRTKVFNDEEINRTLAILYSEFGTRAFPLNNSQDKVGIDIGGPGFGQAYCRAVNRNGVARYTSRLASILQEIGVFVRDSTRIESLHWTLNNTELGLCGPSPQVNIRAYLTEYLLRTAEA